MTLCRSAIRTSLSLALTLILPAGCMVTRQGSVLTSSAAPHDIPQQVQTLENTVKMAAEPSARGRTYLELASLYVSHHNPAPDYGRALKALESCVEIDPADCSSDEIKNWMAVLRELKKRREALFPQDGETKNFPERTKQLEEAVQRTAEPSARTQVYLELASLYVSHRNPAPDYGRALKALESCATTDPANCSSDQIKTWMVVLRELNRVSKEYRDLKDTVDKLQNIEIKIEEKRKQVQ